MKLVPLVLIVLTLAVNVKPQKYRQEHFPFSPQFQTPSSGIFVSDSSLYLPPESHTPHPYFAIKNHNLQFPYLPPTGTKAPSVYPTPFPLLVSSSLVPNFDDDDDDDDSGRIRMSTPQAPQQRFNNSERGSDPAKERREMRAFPNMAFHQPIDRVDTKFPTKIPNNSGHPQGVTTQASANQSPATRRMIISAETHRNDLGLDQIKAASYQGNQFINPIFVSSTTEPAIPIIRLSNEMDLDGSFSYEALGADQTHYVQHSRMENMGTEKQEQVVEGSYSYVGDNGQTYTVHYIADSNGFRASGDHLPVAPPVPEIIQRAVQYNLQEEAKKPQHLKSWQDEQKDNEISESHHYIPPPRNLFTGRTPEAFSYSYSQGSNTGNNLVTSASNQVPVKSNEIPTDQSKSKPTNGPITPQITFLASQGAHLPSINPVQNTISRMFTTEKTALPQLINYEAAIKDMDQQESNKALWRWQYGINANNLNQNSNKDSISRSFGEPLPDDVMINFSEMNPDQYTKMIKSQYESNSENIGLNQNPQLGQPQNHQLGNYYQSQDSNTIKENQSENNNQFPLLVQTQNHQFGNYYQSQDSHSLRVKQNENINKIKYPQRSENKQPGNQTIPQSTQSTSISEDWYNFSNNNQKPQYQPKTEPIESQEHKLENKPKLITQHNFVQTPSYDVTQSYDFEQNYYEPRRIKSLKSDVNVVTNVNNVTTPSNLWVKQPESEVKISTAPEPVTSTGKQIKFVDFIVPEEKNILRPIIKTTEFQLDKEITTTESNVEEIIEQNIFLKNLFKVEKSEPQNENNVTIDEPRSITENPWKEGTTARVEAEPKTDKVPKFIQYVSNSKPINEIKTFKTKPMDITDILNYVTLKNHFESNKMMPKGKAVNTNSYDHHNDIRFIPIQHEIDKSKENHSVEFSSNSNFRSLNHKQEELPPPNSNFKLMNQEQKEVPLNSKLRTFNHELHELSPNNNFRTLNHEQRELRGIIKNYKVLQRNNSPKNYDNHQLKRELSPPPLKTSSPNLPPLGRAGPSMKSYLPPIYV